MRGPAVTVRKAGEDDVPALFHIRTSVVQNAMSMDELEAAGVTHEAVAELLREGRAAAWLAGRGHEPGGFSMARLDEGDVFALFVRPEAEGQGLGTALLAEAERWLRAQGIIEAWLLTGGEPGLRAPGFYAARGWRATGREADGQIRFVKNLESAG